MNKDELINAISEKEQGFNSILEIAQKEERELTEDEMSKVDELKSQVRELKTNLTEVERQERLDELKNNELQRAKEELDAKVRELIDESEAEAEVELAYAKLEELWGELDDAWEEYFDAEEKLALAKFQSLVKEIVLNVLNDVNARSIERKLNAEKEEEIEKIKRDYEEKNIVRNNKNNNNNLNDKKMSNNLFEIVREQIKASSPQTILMQRGAAEGSTDVMGSAIPVGVNELDVVGKEPIWKQMGVDYLPGVSGTYTLPYESPIVGELLAEMAAAIGDTVTPSGTLVSPKRYTVHKTFTVETLNSASDSFLQSIMNDMLAGCDRAITKDIYKKISAGASEVSGADLSKDGFDALMAGAEVEADGAFFSARKTFFDAKGVAIDAGSGRFLVENVGAASIGKGLTYDGVDYWYSSLFEDATGETRVAYGDAAKIHVADYEVAEVIIDKYTKAAEGEVIFTVNKIACVALKNPLAFAKTPDIP